MAVLAVAACAKAPDCDRARESDIVQESAMVEGASAQRMSPPRRRPVPPPTPAPAPLVGERIARAEWAKASQKAGCAPLALISDGGADGTARRADFSGGWGVAFDQPGLRSAYGFAGPGVLPLDTGSAQQQRERLRAQWPLMMDIDTLPAPSFAGYGLSGAAPYPATNPEGYGLHSVAYLRVGGQACTYNIWSRISRAHLEALLNNVRLLR